MKRRVVMACCGGAGAEPDDDAAGAVVPGAGGVGVDSVVDGSVDGGGRATGPSSCSLIDPATRERERGKKKNLPPEKKKKASEGKEEVLDQ